MILDGYSEWLLLYLNYDVRARDVTGVLNIEHCRGALTETRPVLPY